MKDITIKGTTLIREILWGTVCFITAFLINVYAVVHYDRPAIELLSQIGFVAVIAAVLYAVLAVVRVALKIVLFPFRRRRRRNYNRTNYFH